MAGVKARRSRLGLVLGGGAARGIAHAGVLRVLESEGVRPDLIVGTSAGAIAGVLLAAGYPAQRVAAWSSELRWGVIARPAMSRMGLITNERLGRRLEHVLKVRTFDELKVPFACLATDLETFEPVLLCEGDLISAIRASCALPGIVVPVERDGRVLIDGGVTENVPTRIARLLGAETIIAVDVNRSYRRPHPPTSMLGVLMQAFFTLGRAAERLATQDADVLIAPDVGDIGPEELDRAPELIAAGEAAARAALPQLRALLRRRPRARTARVARIPVIAEGAA